MSKTMEYVGKYSSIKHLWEYGLRVKEFSRKRVVKYIFFVTLTLRVFTSVYVGYQYVRFSSDRIVAKGGTLVEGIFGTTSYLPYLNNDNQARFYQSLLFNSCLDYIQSGQDIAFVNDFCNVQTSDHKTFNVTLHTGKVRSDGTPVSLDDILFTYSSIIQGNKRKIPLFEQYTTIEISQTSTNSIRFTFPQASVDNKLFFTYAILPNHILKDTSIDEYQTLFSTRPIYTNCARIKPQSSDPYSLIFDLTQCQDTHLGFFQIKNLQNFDTFRATTENDQKTIVDIYQGPGPIKGFEKTTLPSNQYATIFFNTASEKLRVRARRALAGLVIDKFYEKEDYTQFFEKNHWLFETFLSTGGFVKEFLEQLAYTKTGLSKKDLTDAGVTVLPDTLSYASGKKYVFFVEEDFTQKSLTVTITGNWESLMMSYNGKETTISSYNKRSNTLTYLISVPAKTLTGGLNKYVIYGKDKDGKKEGLVSIDIYYLKTDAVGVPQANKIRVLYHAHETSSYIIKTLEEIFAEAGILEYFAFEGFATYDEMEGRIINKNYDIVITSIDMGLKQDISSLFGTDKVQVNPSQYINTNFVTQIQMYLYNKDPKIFGQIQETYARDMPLIILGKQFVPLYIKNATARELFHTLPSQHNTWRQTMYNHIRLVKNVHFDRQKMWNMNNFFVFINNTLRSKK